LTTNEAIARWTGRLKPLDDPSEPRLGDIVASAGPGGFSVIVALEDKRWFGGPAFTSWSPDTDIALWHGPGGLLAEIEKKGLHDRFVISVSEIMASAATLLERSPLWMFWTLLRAEPAQLADALRKCIEGEA
jgi:hypothetical protein